MFNDRFEGQEAQEVPMDLFLGQQNIDRYSNLLRVVSDVTQRRQIQNLLEEEREKVQELQQSVSRNDRPKAV